MDTLILTGNDANCRNSYSSKHSVHKEGLLHIGFSCFAINSDKKLLLQKRCIDKYHSGGLWSNTCCGHIAKNDTSKSLIDVVSSRVFEELNIDVNNLRNVSRCYYKCQFPNGMTENEFDYIFLGHCNINDSNINDINFNKQEVEAVRLITFNDLKHDIKIHPELYSYWLVEIINRGLIDMYFRD